ncbi:hypothetical protein PTKIN_Ptkin06aG0170100 [Pterospermum kingtungense]
MENRLITKVLNPGDAFVFPVGLIHFQFNIGKTNAVAGLSSQNPGVITIANAVFGSNPPINPDVLTKAFRLDKNIVTNLRSRFWKLLRVRASEDKTRCKGLVVVCEASRYSNEQFRWHWPRSRLARVGVLQMVSERPYDRECVCGQEKRSA